MGHEPGVLVHDVRPESDDLAPVELRLTTRETAQPSLPALGLVPGVIEEQRPDEAPELAARLCVAQSCLVLDERLDRFIDVPRESLQLGSRGGRAGVDPLVEG